MLTKMIIRAAMVAGALIVGMATAFLCRNKGEPIAEVCEDIIEEVTGIEVDFISSDEQ
jgi:type IV secretory pathway VirB2 component (pilin)